MPSPDTIAAWAGLALALATLTITLFGAKGFWVRVMVAFISVLAVIVGYFAIDGLLDERARQTTRSDVERLLEIKGPMSFEDIYAQIAPPRDLASLTQAIESGLKSKTITAERQAATLDDNTLVGVRVYNIGPGAALSGTGNAGD